ncbi:MAG: hypothetical protein KDC92_14680, partial [Bacteroidetes bacterium]|nr:hypothetical protein [Bacteroidota bacterium]
GFGLNYIRYNFITNDKELNNRVEQSGEAYSASLVFGWDIRPSEVEWFILRTNLRYQPRGNMSSENKNYFSNDLEFNFIQMVVYPERMKYYFGK